MIAFAALGLFSPALMAVHNTGKFELDGNADSLFTDDWDRVCYQVAVTPVAQGGLGLTTQQATAKCTATSATTGASAVAWTTDNLISGTPSANATIFTGGGSKDPIDINQWAWKDGAGGLPDKDNLLHAFAARYKQPSSPSCPGVGGETGGATTCDVIFFGSDRYDNSGDAQQGFWFLQNTVTLANNAVGGGSGFSGVHRAGDLLVVSDFSNGGTTSTITAYSWDPTCTKTTGSTKGFCGDANLRILDTSAAANCATSQAGDTFCGIVNPGTITMPWSFTDKSNTPNKGALQGELYEAGINLSKLNLSGECFATVESETRSSTSTTAVLKDLILATFGRCDSGLTTTPTDGSGNAIPSAGLSIGHQSDPGGSIVTVKDAANLNVSGALTWTGKLTFYLCGPDTGLCASGGTLVGTVDVSDKSTFPVLSPAATVTSVGRYCFRGEFVADGNAIPPASDASDGECFTVNPVPPAIITSATPQVTIGSPISDSVTLSLTANQPGSPVINGPLGAKAGGTITVNLYGPSAAPNCSGTPVTTQNLGVNGDGQYPTTPFTPTAAGTYYWVASYTGNSPNTTGPVAGTCGDSFEVSVVRPKQPTISTNATAGPVLLGSPINDVATLTGTSVRPDGSPAGGTITFTLYGPSATVVCTTPILTRVVNVSGDGNYSAGSYTPTASGTYYWIAAYSGDSPNTLSVTGHCGDANEASVVNPLPKISSVQTFTIQDTATISGKDAAGSNANLSGTVRFRLFNNATCSAGTQNVNVLYDSASSGNIAVSGVSPQTVSSGTTQITTTQTTLSWLVEYTDNSHPELLNVSSTCNTENASLTINNGPQQ